MDATTVAIDLAVMPVALNPCETCQRRARRTANREAPAMLSVSLRDQHRVRNGCTPDLRSQVTGR